MTIKLMNLEILLKTKEEKAWLMKEKSDNFKEYWIKKSKRLMIKIKKFKNTMKKVIEMTNNLNSWEIKFKNKEEKVKLMKELLKN